VQTALCRARFAPLLTLPLLAPPHLVAGAVKRLGRGLAPGVVWSGRPAAVHDPAPLRIACSRSGAGCRGDMTEEKAQYNALSVSAACRGVIMRRQSFRLWVSQQGVSRAAKFVAAAQARCAHTD
jgi:hypothetical protein